MCIRDRRLGLELAEKSGADLMLATDPDADRVGIAVKCKDGSYEPVSYTHLATVWLPPWVLTQLARPWVAWRTT